MVNSNNIIYIEPFVLEFCIQTLGALYIHTNWLQSQYLKHLFYAGKQFCELKRIKMQTKNIIQNLTRIIFCQNQIRKYIMQENRNHQIKYRVVFLLRDFRKHWLS